MSLIPQISGVAVPGRVLPSTMSGGAALALDWDASRGTFSDAGGTTPATIGGSVYTWTDNASGLLAQQSTAGLRPTLNVDQNLFPVLRFLGTSTQYLSAANNAALNPATGMYTVFAVARMLSDDTLAILASCGNSASTITGWNIFVDSSNGLIVTRCCAVAASRAGQSLPVLTGITQPVLIVSQMTGSQINGLLNGSATGWVNGGDGPSGNTYTGTINNADPLTIGCSSAIASFASMDLYRLAAYKGTLSAGDLSQITTQLMSVYRLSAFPPTPAAAAIIGPSATTALWTSATDFYRIPALACDGTTIVAACEHRFGSVSDSGHIEIQARSSTDNGSTWAAAVVAASNGTDCARNPSLVADPARGKFHLVFCKQLASATQTDIVAGLAVNSVWYTSSSDGGATWASEVEISSQVMAPTWRWFAPGPGAGIITQSGRILIGADHSDPAYVSGTYKANAIYSDDGGTTWSHSAAFGPQGTDETTVTQMPSGQVVASSRSSTPFRIDTRSEDSGATWGNSVSRADEYGIATEGQLLYVSPWLLKSGIVCSTRVNLGVWLSNDGGSTWRRRSRVFTGASAYSSLCRTPNGTIGVLYEQGASAFIEFMTFTLPSSP